MPIPDYELEDVRVIDSPVELRAVAGPLRGAILGLVQERAATVSELARAVERPKSTVAYHVGVLVDAGLLKVVRTRKVRAVEERFYGRTARTFYVGSVDPQDLGVRMTSQLTVAAAEAVPAMEADDLRAMLRHARIPSERAAEFWYRVIELSHEFLQLPHGGDTVYGFVAALYPTDQPTLSMDAEP